MFSHLGQVCVLHLPRKIRLTFDSYVKKAGFLSIPYDVIGKAYLLAIISSIFLTAYVFLKNQNPVLAPFVLVISYLVLTGLAFAGVYVYFEVKIFQRTAKIEEVLPDFLQEVAVNLRAGMTFDKALWNSVEPEFGILEKEIEIVAKKVMSGEDTEEALKEFAEKYESALLKESMDLIIIGIRSGGEISDLIDRVVQNVKEASYLKKELLANVMSYVIFITLISVAIAPMLFALSFNLMQIIQTLLEKLASSGTSAITGGADITITPINPNDFIAFSRYSIIIISAATSVIIADLREGSIKGGFKYIFLFIGGGLICYQISLWLFNALFGFFT
jgi:archaellum biogenesis protein FlaJ (TadC family)